MPERIQLSRKKGWRKPEGAVIVARPSKWGNPFRLDEYAVPFAHYEARASGTVFVGVFPREPAEQRRCARDDFADAVRTGHALTRDGATYPSLDQIRAELAGHDLACWCPLDQPCHADVLLPIANS